MKQRLPPTIALLDANAAKHIGRVKHQVRKLAQQFPNMPMARTHALEDGSQAIISLNPYGRDNIVLRGARGIMLACGDFPRRYTWDTVVDLPTVAIPSVVTTRWLKYSVGGGWLGNGGSTIFGMPIGLRFAPEGDGVFGVDDYISPGSPYEGTCVVINGGNPYASPGQVFGFNNAGATWVPWQAWGGRLRFEANNTTPWTLRKDSDTHYIATVQHTLFNLLIQYYTPDDKPMIRIRIEYTNTTNADQDVKLSRGMDPDPDVVTYNSYDTQNAVGYKTIPAKNLAYALGAQTGKPVAIYTDGSGFPFSAQVNEMWNAYPIDVLKGGVVGRGVSDAAIVAAWDFGTVQPGMMREVYMCYICGNDMSVIG